MGYSEKTSGSFIYFAVFTTSLTAFVTGFCFVWTSPMLPKFNSTVLDTNPIGRPATLDESAWIVAAMPFGLIFGPIVSILSQKCCTKKTVLLISVSPIFIAHVICIFASQAITFIIARFLMGVGSGAVWCVLGTYIAEISEDRNRGLLGSVPGITSNLGSLSVYVLGPYLSMTWFSITALIPLVLFYIGFGFFVPNSPYDLLMKKKYLEAEMSLKILRKRFNIDKELTLMKETIHSEKSDEAHFTALLKDQGLRKGLLICVALMTFQQLSGILAVVSYAQTIFQLAGDLIPSAISPMLIGIVGTSANIISSFMVDTMGRKILLAGSCALETISLFLLGTYFYLKDSGVDVSNISWIPVVSVMIFIISFNIALGIVPWIVTGEVFHSKVKPLATNITALTNYLISFLVAISFPYIHEYFGIGCTFWIFAVAMTLGFVFCIIVLPETKGKSFQEIQKMFKS